MDAQKHILSNISLESYGFLILFMIKQTKFNIEGLKELMSTTNRTLVSPGGAETLNIKSL